MGSAACLLGLWNLSSLLLFQSQLSDLALRCLFRMFHRLELVQTVETGLNLLISIAHTKKLSSEIAKTILIYCCV